MGMLANEYKAVITNQNCYEEFVLVPVVGKAVRVGTKLGCDVRFYKEHFRDEFWIEFNLNQEQWTIKCSDNLYIYTGDVRKISRSILNNLDVLSFRYSGTNLDAFDLEFYLNYESGRREFRRCIDLSGREMVSIGTCETNDIVCQSGYIADDAVELRKIKGRFYGDTMGSGKRIGGCELKPEYGCRALFINGNHSPAGGVIYDHDFFSIADIMFFYKDGKLWTEVDRRTTVKAIPFSDLPSRRDYPKFVRNTREQVDPSKEEISILDPPPRPTMPRTNLVMNLLPAFGMMLTSGIMATMGGGMVLYSAVSGGMAIVIAVAGMISSKKDYEKELAERESKYLAYEQKKRAELQEIRSLEKTQRNEIYTDIQEESRRLFTFSNDLFDRAEGDVDFLDVRIGTGTVEPFRKIEYKKQEQLETDELFQIPEKISRDFSGLEESPVVLKLGSSNVIGVIGNKNRRYSMLRNIIFDLSIRQYHTDYSLFLVVRPENYAQIQWARFLPSLIDAETGERNIVCDDASRSLVFDRIYKELSQREREKHYRRLLVIFCDTYGFRTHPASIFLKEADAYGATFLFMGDDKAQLPMYCDEIVYLTSDEQGKVVCTKDRNKTTAFTYLPLSEKMVENMAFELAPVYADEISLEGKLTRSITLFQLLGMYSVEDLELSVRWKASHAEKSMSVPIGVTKNGVVRLDLHEKAHGPHGLVAGTTGSGKSELLQTYILSIAVNFHPHDVGFVIIDFKGGGMVNQFLSLPHLLGTITNIDGKEIDRSLKFIKAELQRRQRWFSAADVNHIDKYIEAYKSGRVSEPLPHLILIVDEFAELRAQQPDFMQELISAARIGRSLGVHLILATQKPAGQVDDQIWSNSRFRFCLKVQDKEDSNDVLKTPVAAEIKEPGRAYFQVGNNEIFELFQSAYSGAPESVLEETQKPFTIYDVMPSGKRTSVYSRKKESEESSSRTQLESIVEYVSRKFAETGDTQPAAICLPPLKTVLPYKKEGSKRGTSVCIGYYDDPERQAQPAAMLSIEDKHTFVLGSSQYGKTNLLMVIIRSIAANTSPRDNIIYVMDFGSMMLKQFEKLPHVGGVVTASEDEKLRNLIKLLEEEMIQRKEKMNSAGVGSFSAYREAGFQDLPHILLIIDNLLAAQELYFEDDDSLLRLIRESLPMGISVIATNLQTSGIGYRYLSNFANMIAFYCNDRDEYMSVFDYTVQPPNEVRGRCLIQVDKEVKECQTYLAFEGEKEIERSECIRDFCAEIAQQYDGLKARPIPFIPSVLTREGLEHDYQLHQEPWKMPAGLAYQDVTPFYLALDKLGILGFCGQQEDTKKRFIEGLFEYLQQMVCKEENALLVNILDDFSRMLEPLKAYPFVENYTLNVKEAEKWIESLYEELSERYEDMLNAQRMGSLHAAPLHLFLIQNNDFAQEIEDDEELREKFEEIQSRFKNMKVSFLFTNIENTSISYSSPLPLSMLKEEQHLIFFENLDHLKLFDLDYSVLRENQKKIDKGDAFYLKGEEVFRVKLAL